MFEALLADMRELDIPLTTELDQEGTHLFGGSSGFADVVGAELETKQKSLEKEQLHSRINLSYLLKRLQRSPNFGREKKRFKQ